MVTRLRGVPERDDPVEPDGWHLRSATLAVVDGLHRLACEPLVYRYLFRCNRA